MDSGTKGTTHLSSDWPLESVRPGQHLLEIVAYMNSSLGQDFAKQSIFLGRIWIMITIMTTIY